MAEENNQYTFENESYRKTYWHTLFEYPGVGIMKKFASEKMSDHVVAGVT